MNKKSANKEEKSKYWLDQPANVKKIIHGFYWLCGLVILADIIFSLVWHKHAIFKEDVSCIVMKPCPHFMGYMDFLPAWVWFMFRN